MSEKLDLTALIGSRICHDLISPIGAIGNGVELMLMDGAQSSVEMALVSESVAHANAKIRFFRLAFGASGGDSLVARSEVVEVLADMTRGTRLRIEVLAQGKLPRASVKLGFLLIMCLETAMPYGGTIEITQGDDRWILRGTAERFKVEAPLWDMLQGGPAVDLTPAQVQFALVGEEVARQHRRLTTEISGREIRFVF